MNPEPHPEPHDLHKDPPSPPADHAVKSEFSMVRVQPKGWWKRG